MKIINKSYFDWICNCFYVKIIKGHVHHACDKNDDEYVTVGTFPQQISCHCKFRKCVDK